MQVTDLATLKERLSTACPDEIHDALIDIGKAGLESLADDIAPFLTHPTCFVRGAAIRVLAFYWQKPAYRETAERMWRTDPEQEVRGIALMGWAQYAAGSKDPDVQRTLIEIVRNTEACQELRAQAWMSLFAVLGIPPERRPAHVPYGHVDEDVDWELLEQMARALSGL